VLDPFSLLPLSLAAQRGRVDDFEVQQLVAAGLALLQRSAPLVRTLSRKRAAILLPTSPAFFVALAACEGRGAVLINPLAARGEIAHQLSDANVGAVFTSSALADTLPADIPRVLLDDAPRSARTMIDGVSRDVDLGSHVGMTIEGDADVRGSADEAVIVYTSAMAGIPLGAILSHRNLLSNARAASEATGLSPDDRVLALLPFSHLFGLTVTGSGPLLAGAHVSTMSRFSPARAVELLEQEAITMVVGVPAVFRAMLAAIERRGAARLDALRICICGGAPLSESLQERWFDANGVELRQGYGLTEAGPVCLFNRIGSPNARGTLGVPFPGVEVDLHAPIAYDEAGLPLGSSTDTGALEICVRGDNVFRGYVSGGERGLPIRDGWLHTGDLGRRTSGGEIAFAGVEKPMFTRNGFNIYPRELEQAVLELPGVRAARVRGHGAPDAECEIRLDVEAEADGDVDEDAVRHWCAARLSAYKQPGEVVIAPRP
jgi:acyl-CoA synthetase (AMP-forming)/AMP-acid ligase II